MKELISFTNSLLKIKYNSFTMVILLIPPVYGLWLFAVGRRILQKKKVLDYLFACLTLALTMFLFVFPNCSLLYLVKSWNFSNQTFELFASIGLLLFLLTSILLAIMTLNYEAQWQSGEKIKITFIDYFVRFYILQNWWVGIWAFQRIVTTYYVVEIENQRSCE